ncbi:MAG: hypothetical protein HUJ69_03485 [Lachnospiraceae bacterium]|nr:hypothetical protein [Lachnospiraceae bacterium]
MEHPEVIAEGDSVKCRCMTEGLYRSRTVLLYPGKELPGAEQAEKDAVGKKQGESFATELGGLHVELSVEEISRHSNTVVSDKMVQLEQLDGVNTISEYREWCRQSVENRKKEALAEQIAAWFYKNALEKSEYSIDEAEMKAWAYARAKMFFELELMGKGQNAMEIAADPVLYDREIEERAAENTDHFREYLLQIAIANAGGIHYGPEETAARIVDCVKLFDLDYSDYDGIMSRVNMTYFMEVVYLEGSKEILIKNALAGL